MPEVNHPKPDKCPECGADASNGERFFACDSYWLYQAGHVHQSERCRIRELESTVAWLRKALKLIADRDESNNGPCANIARTALEETK